MLRFRRASGHATITPVMTLAMMLATVAGPVRADVDAAADAFVAWLGANAVPLRTVEAGNGFDDMAPIRAMVGDARIVSLGEATHGTREFFQAKHRLLEYLVSELGFTAFGIEASYPDCVAINRYVVDGIGDPEEALHGQGFWTWDTEEVLALIEWMRAWNADPACERPVRFYGFDMQASVPALEGALPYLRRFEGIVADEIEERLAPLAEPGYAERQRAMHPDDHAAIVEAAEDLVLRIDRSGRRLEDGPERAAWARQHAIVVTQYVEMVAQMNAGGPSIGTRELMRLSTTVPTAAAWLDEYLGRFDADTHVTAGPVLGGLAENVRTMIEAFQTLSPGERRDRVRAITTARDRLGELAAHFRRRSSPEAHAQALAYVNDVATFLVACDELASSTAVHANVRDRAMAENVAWILAQEGPDGRVVLWSHNGHAMQRPAPAGAGSMGNELERRFADDHVVVGFAFAEGSFQAIHSPADGRWDGRPALRSHMVGPPPDDHVGAVLARAGLPILLADLRAAPVDGPVSDWLDRAHPMRMIGALFTPGHAARFTAPVQLRDDYDAILFVRETTAARPLPLTRAKYGM